VRQEGFEPSRPCGHWFLRPARLPFRHQRISPGRREIPLPALAVVSRSAHGDTRWCVPCYVCTVLGCPLPRLTRPFASELISTAPDMGVDSCSPRPILVTGSRRPGNYRLLQQFRRPARLLDADVQVPACLGDLVRLAAQVGHLDGGDLLQLAAQLTGPGDLPAATGSGVRDRGHQPVLGRVSVALRQRVGEGEARRQLGRAVGPVDPADQFAQLADERPALGQELVSALGRLLALLLAGHRGGPRRDLLKLLLLASPIG
jgi:hypothetical protein